MHRVGESVESALSAFAAIFRLLSRILTISTKMPYFDVLRQKRVLFDCIKAKQCLGMLVSSH